MPARLQDHEWIVKHLTLLMREVGISFSILRPLRLRMPHLTIKEVGQLVEKDFDLIGKYGRQVRLQVSVATLNEGLARLIEPRIVSPTKRMEILAKAKLKGLRTGIIVAHVFPPTSQRSDVKADLEKIAHKLSEIKPDFIYGESLHIRGINIAYIENALGQKLDLNGFDKEAEQLFHESLSTVGLKGRWWREY